jgi:hypothetical protein
MKKTLDLDGLTVTVTLQPDMYGRPTVVELNLSGRAVTAEDLRKIPIGRMEQQAATSGNRQPLHAREPGESSDDFSVRVSEAFKAVAATTRWPAGILAKEAGVTVGTAHNWIREARIRGLLPPAERRKSGGGPS